MKKHENADLKALIQWVESQPRFRPKTDLKRMKQALEMKGIHLNETYMIHVAGTNGKGSVCQYLTQILMAKGLNVGTFTSPYILNFNERITINDQPLSDRVLMMLLRDIKSFNNDFEQTYKERLSFFELLTLAALMIFQSQNLDVVIMEVGIGGLLDATNAYGHYDLSLITNIGFDHMTQLGNTLESIAFNKLGILKSHGKLLTTVDKTLRPFFSDYAKKHHAEVTFLDRDVNILSEVPLIFEYKGNRYQPGLNGDYQVDNAILAIEAIKQTPFSVDTNTIKKGLMQAYIPARFTEIEPLVIVDGAHNSHAIDALKKTIKKAYHNHKVHIVFSALGDKDIEKMLVQLESFSDQLDLVSFPDPRFVSLESFQTDRRQYVEDDVLSYLKNIIHQKTRDEVIIITGSLHFVGYILNHYK